MNMTDIVEYISYLIAGIIIAPFGYMLFKEFIGKDRKTVTDEVKSTVGDESRKFLGGRYGDAVVGQFVELKLIIAIGLPVVLFLGMSSLVNSLLKLPKTGGYVQINYLIDSNGEIFNPTIVDSSPKGEWDLIALKALSKVEYVPSEFNSSNIPVYVTSEFKFVEQ